MRIIYSLRSLITVVCAAAIVACFFLPWIRVHTAPAAVLKVIGAGEDSSSILTTSGAGVPRLANGKSAEIFVKILGLFTSSVDGAGWKSYLIWSVPLLAIVVLVLSVKHKGSWMVSVLLGAVCAALAMGAAFKLLTTDLDKVLVRVQVCWPVWITLLAFFIIGMIHLGSVPMELGRSARRK